MAVGDVVWLANQNTLRSQYKLGRVVNVNTDNKGIVRDANIRTFPSYPISTLKHVHREKQRKKDQSKSLLQYFTGTSDVWLC